ARIVDVNETACDELGYEREELLSLRIPDILTQLPHEETWDGHIDRLRIEDGVLYEVRHVRKDGTTFPVEVNASSVVIDGDEYVIAVARDITHRIERERELQRQIDRLDEFAGFVSHDLRNPLNVLQGSLDCAMATGDDEAFDRCQRAANRMESLIHDLLTLAKEGDVVDDTVLVDGSQVVADSWHAVDTADARLVVATERTYRADEERLRQLLENLFRNAVEHGGEDVLVSVGELDDGFYVEDDGPGIPVDEHERVFSSGYSRGESGTGFGLAIVECIADAHGWHVAVTDGTAGGARFEITGVDVVD
ncbi:MAG: sensor histidine kinase, partial [Halobacteriota archaeon]